MPTPKLKLVSEKPKQINCPQWNDLVKSIDDLSGEWQFGEIINIEGWLTLKYKEIDNYVFILADITTEPACGCESELKEFKKHGLTRPTKILDSPIRGKFVEIYFRLRRYLCLSCKKTVQQTISGQANNHSLTQRLKEYIERESLNIYKNNVDISHETGVSECMIRKLASESIRELEKHRQIKTPRYISLDENFVSTRKKVVCVITSPEEQIVLEILKDNNPVTIRRFLEQIPNPEKIEVVSIDMAPQYVSVLEKTLSKATIVIDRYHVQNLLNKELKAVLSVIKSRLTETQIRNTMDREVLLLKNRHKLGKVTRQKRMEFLPSEKQAVKDWLKEYPLLFRAYSLKEDFCDILQLSDRKLAESRTDLWLKKLEQFVKDFGSEYKKECIQLNKKPFAASLISFRYSRKYILNYIDYKFRLSMKVTNGFAEFANKQIKKANRKGNGLNYDILRAKVLYGGILRKPLPVHPLKSVSKKSVRKPRKLIKKKYQNPNSNINLIKNERESKDELLTIQRNKSEEIALSKRIHISDCESLNQEERNFEDDADYSIENSQLIIYNKDRNNFRRDSSTKKSTKIIEVPPLFKLFDNL